MAERALILSADAWEMADEKTGELRKGVSVWFINDYREDTHSAIGYKPTKVSAESALLDSLRRAQLPAMFEMHYGSRPGAQGKATLTLIKADHVGNVKLFGEPAAPKAS
ncbi:hypothetical protein D3C81_2052050 [compost metagenome]